MSLSTRSLLAAINHLLAPANWARERLAPFAGRHACVRAQPIECRFTVAADGFLQAADEHVEPAVTLSVPLAALPNFLGGNADKAMGTVRIEGNADFADALGFVFRNLRWDAEEDLARIFGDIVAHRLVDSANALRRSGERAWGAFGANLAEYLTEEQQTLVTRAALERHSDGLRQLRDDIARLGKRLDRLSAAGRR